MYLTKELRQKALQELRWMALILEEDLETSDWPASEFAKRVKERAENAARAIEGLTVPKEQKTRLLSLFTHKGRVHVQFPEEWVKQEPLYGYEDSSNGPVAYVFFISVGKAFKMYEDWSGSQAGFVQPVPKVEQVSPEGIEWRSKAPKIFEPIDKVRIYGGSNTPIVLGAN